MTSPASSGRRSRRSHEATLAAAFELATEVGYAQVTIEGIAARAGVGKQTIYRWWPSKGTVVLEAVNEKVGSGIDFRSTGDVIADLTGQMSAVVGLLNTEMGDIFTGLIAEAQSDPVLTEAILDTIVRPRTRECADLLKEGQRLGQIRDDVDLDAAVELLYAPLYYRLLLRIAPLSTDHVADVLALAFRGLRP
ncbi:TetR/AcrR family transcriptional regulator [Kitasatospora sp. NPDC096128]|uniref:TetR/AcrR family transcriptional regulator n=1 Tax=Kitasatospora sp. NPDC096128 TaxID=3155547 RepID=UPI00332C6424